MCSLPDRVVFLERVVLLITLCVLCAASTTQAQQHIATPSPDSVHLLPHTASAAKSAYPSSALSCSINTACPEGDPWADVARAVVRIDRGGTTCTGVLLNNTAEDFTPYILTAHHCGTPAVGDTLDWTVTLNYASPTCATPETPPSPRSMRGVVVRAAHDGWREDFALLELLNPIPPAYQAFYAGWSIANVPPPSGATISHPHGDLRKLALAEDPFIDMGARWVTTFNQGTVESGSSGAPLFDANRRVVGHVRGAWSLDANSCSGPGGDDNAATIVFPKLAHIWTVGPPGAQVRDFLDPDDTGAITLDGRDGTYSPASPHVWVNELDTRTADAEEHDTAEFIELAGPAGHSLDGYRVEAYACTNGRAERRLSETIAASLTDDHNGTGYFVLGGPDAASDAVDQHFSGEAPDRLADGHGLIILRDPSGREVFDYQYDAHSDGQPRACPASRRTRSRADDYDYDASPSYAATTASSSEGPSADVTLGSTSIGFEAGPPATDDAGAEGILPSPGQTNATAMPVELVRFAAVANEQTVRLQWSTASETHNAGFEVQHAMDGDFVTRDFVEGHGTTTRSQSYTFTTAPLLAGMHRFRLRQVDTDGTASLSPVVEVAVGSSSSHELTTPHPNPARQTASATLTVAEPQHVEATLYDVLGRQVALLHRGDTPAHQPLSLQVDAHTLSSGLYILRVAGEHFIESRKVTVLR